MRTIDEIILHCSATKESQYVTVDDIRKWHKQQGYTDIGYNWIIELDGTLSKGRDEEKVGAHCLNHNKNSIGICYIGGLDNNGKAKDTRTAQQKATMYKIVKDMMNKYGLTLKQVHCHNEYNKNKDCPCFMINQFRKEYSEWEQNEVKVCPHCGKPI